MIENASLLAALGFAFVAGLASFLSPCVLPLVPVYIASMAGPEILDTEIKKERLRIFLHSLSFVVGFSIIFSLWGAGAGLLGSVLISYTVVIRYIVGSLLIIFGLVMLAALKVPWLNYERHLNISSGSGRNYRRSFLIGAIFCFAWIPCLSWQIAAILSLAGSTATVWKGTYLLAIYSLGLGLPFLVVGIAFDAVTPLLKRIQRYSRIIYIFSGLLMIALGILVIMNKLILLATI